MTMNASAAPAVTQEIPVHTNLIVIHGGGNGQPPAPPRLPSAQPEIVQMPFSPGTQLVDDVLMAGTVDRIKLLCSRRNKYLNCNMQLERNGNELRISSEKNENHSTIHVTDLTALKAGYKAARKLFGFLRMKLNQGVVIDGELVQDELSFPLQELVETGLYSSVTSARRGFNAAMPALLSLEMQFKLACRKSSQEDMLAPFVSAVIENGICRIRFEDAFDWNTFFAFYAPTPAWIFSLPLTAQVMALYLHEIARQHPDKVENGEAISLKLETLRCKLCLSENKNWNGCRDILGRVIRAVETIEIRQSAFLKAAELPAISRADELWFHTFPGILFGYDPDEPTTMKEFASARLTFKIGGPVQTELTEFNKRKKKKTEARQKKDEKLQDNIVRIVAERTVDKQERQAAEAARLVPDTPDKSISNPSALIKERPHQAQFRRQRK